MALKDEYFTISEAAKEMFVTRQTISRWVNEGKLTAEKIGRETLIEKEQIDNLIDKDLTQKLGKAFDRRLTTLLKRKYKYTNEDTIEPIGAKKKPFALGYSILKKDGTKEKAWIYIGKID